MPKNLTDDEKKHMQAFIDDMKSHGYEPTFDELDKVLLSYQQKHPQPSFVSKLFEGTKKVAGEVVKWPEELARKAKMGTVPGLKQLMGGYAGIADIITGPSLTERYTEKGRQQAEQTEQRRQELLGKTIVEKIPDIREPIKEAQKYWALTPEDEKKLKEGGLPARITSDIISLVGQLPIYMVATTATGAAAAGPLSKLLPSLTKLYGVKAAIQAVNNFTRIAGSALGLGGVSGAQAVGQGATVGEVLKSTGIGALTGAAFGAAGMIPKTVPRLITGAAVFPVTTAAAGGTPEDILASTVLGIAFTATTIPSLFKERVKKIAKDTKLTNVEKTKRINKELFELTDAEFKEEIKNYPQMEIKKMKIARESYQKAVTHPYTGFRHEILPSSKQSAKTVVMMDMKGLGSINETLEGKPGAEALKQRYGMLGHKAGDAWLKETGDVIRKNIANTDIEVAMGHKADEITLISKSMTSEQIQPLIENIRKELPKFNILEKKTNKPIIAGDAYYKIVPVTETFEKAAIEVGMIEKETKSVEPIIKQPSIIEAISPKPSNLLELGAGIGGRAGREQGVRPLPTMQKIDADITGTAGKYVKLDYIPQISKTKFLNPLEKLYTKVVNRYFPVDKFTGKIDKAKLMEMPSLFNPKIQIRLKNNLINQVAVKLGLTGPKGGTYRYTLTGMEFTGEGLKQITEPFASNANDIKSLEWAMQTKYYGSKQAEAMNKMISEGKEAKPIYTGINENTIKDAEIVINGVKTKYGTAGYNKLVDVVNRKMAWENRAILEPLYQLGKINEKTYEYLKKRPHVPFEYIVEDLTSQDGGEVGKQVNDMLKAFKGSEFLMIKDPDYQKVRRIITVTAWENRQKIIEAVVKSAEIYPDLYKDLIVKGAKGQTITRYKNSTAETWAIKDPWLYDAINDYTLQEMDLVLNVMTTFKNIKRAGATLPIAFQQRNIIRDALHGWITSQDVLLPGIAQANALAAMIGRPESFQKFLVLGAGSSFFEDVQLHKGDYYNALYGKTNRIKYLNPVRVLTKMGLAGENVSRYAEFLKLIKKGWSEFQAGAGAKEVTVNFDIRGKAMKFPQKTTAFYTAAVAGHDRIIRAFKDHPVKSTIKAVTALTLPSILEYYMNKDDDDWRNLPVWRKYTGINIRTQIPGIPFIYIPYPHEVGILFGGLPKALLSSIEKEDPQAVNKWGKQFLETSLPGTYGLPLPDIFVPVLEHATGKQFFFNRPITPGAMEGLPPELQYTPYTTETAKMIGKTTGLAPTIVENYMYGYGSGATMDAIRLAENILKKEGLLKKEIEVPEAITSSPFFRGVVTKEPIGPSSSPVNEIYERFKEAEKYKKGFDVLVDREVKDTNLFKIYQSKSENYDILKSAVDQLGEWVKEKNKTLGRNINVQEKERLMRELNIAMTIFSRRIIDELNKQPIRRVK